ncbi:hypothetical protein tb265_45320 [Gemmatimonadetes bacterium T265]|nr:hypothetical protein tb265_45320 [Gemmatimonadetes bacterium T265]
MPRRPPTRSPAETSAALADRPTPARPHVVDRALAVHRLRAAGQSSAEVQRRLQVSKSTVSVLGYLGAARARMEPASVAELRTPAVTARDVWRLATAAQKAERDARGALTGDAERDQARRRAVVGLRAAFRDHLAHARLTSAVARRRVRQAAGRRVADRQVAGRSAATRAVGWSHAAWADDPTAFAEAHLAARAAEHALAGQVAAAGEGSLQRLGGTRWRALAAAARGARTPTGTQTFAARAVVTRKLREAHDELARLRLSPTGAALDTAPPDVAPADPPGPHDPVRWEDVEEDLRD